MLSVALWEEEYKGKIEPAHNLHGAISAVHINMTFDPLLDCCCSSEFANIPFDFHPIMAILRTIRNIFGFVRPYIGRISCVIS